MFTRFTCFIIAVALAIACCSTLPAQQLTTGARNKSISIVPAPGKVVIDGKLDDRDLSGEILTYSFPETAEKYNVRTALMYDRDVL